jgi:CheY-like chemotaxis protein
MDKLKILVADDDAAVRNVYRGLLEREGHEVILAEDGGVAIELIEKHGDFDVVISDVAMPKAPGQQVLRVAKEKMPKARLLLNSGALHDAVKEDADNLGVDAYYLKTDARKMLLELGIITGTV